MCVIRIGYYQATNQKSFEEQHGKSVVCPELAARAVLSNRNHTAAGYRPGGGSYSQNRGESDSCGSEFPQS